MKPVFFTDRDLGNTFPNILSASGLSVQRHSDHFEPDCPDERWLRVIGEHGWVAVSRDRRIRYKPNERDAVIRHNVILLVVIGTAPHAELAHQFLATVPRIERFLDRHRPPLIARVHRAPAADLQRNPAAPGTVSLWYPEPPKTKRTA